MNSIKSKLLLTLLPSLGILWLLSSSGLYFYVKRSLYETMDNELRIISENMQILFRRHPHNSSRKNDKKQRLFDEGGEFYFQIWKKNGDEHLRSSSLGDREFEQPGEFNKERVLDNGMLTDGTQLRTIRTRIKPRWPRMDRNKEKAERRSRERPHFDIIVGRDAKTVEATLAKLRLGIGLSTIFGVLGAALAVTLSVRRGLSPLGRFSENLTQIGSQNLDARLDPSGSPKELGVVSDKVNDLLARLESAFNRERRFGSDLAHELRTPTAEIKALAEVGISWPDQFGKEEIEDIFRSASRMEHTTQALLELTRLSSSASPETEELDLRVFIEELLGDFKRSASAKNLTFTPPEKSEEVTITTNRDLLQIILQNLIGNAVAYAPNGDEITIHADQGSLSIENTAPDLEERDLELMFERFWRKDESRTSAEHAGLGLRLVKVCTEKLGHSLETSLDNARLKIRVRF